MSGVRLRDKSQSFKRAQLRVITPLKRSETMVRLKIHYIREVCPTVCRRPMRRRAAADTSEWRGTASCSASALHSPQVVPPPRALVDALHPEHGIRRVPESPSNAWLNSNTAVHVASEQSPKRVLKATVNCASIVKGCS